MPQELEVQKLEVLMFIAPRVVEKASVTLLSSMVNEREAFLCTPQQPMNSSTTFFRRSCPVSSWEARLTPEWLVVEV